MLQYAKAYFHYRFRRYFYWRFGRIFRYLTSMSMLLLVCHSFSCLSASDTNIKTPYLLKPMVYCIRFDIVCLFYVNLNRLDWSYSFHRYVLWLLWYLEAFLSASTCVWTYEYGKTKENGF